MTHCSKTGQKTPNASKRHQTRHNCSGKAVPFQTCIYKFYGSFSMRQTQKGERKDNVITVLCLWFENRYSIRLLPFLPLAVDSVRTVRERFQNTGKTFPLACEQAHLFGREAATESWREEWRFNNTFPRFAGSRYPNKWACAQATFPPI